MALTRKFLSALGIEAEKIDEIITAHTETVDGLKNELAAAKADAAKLPGVQKELDDLKAAQPKDGESWESKYNEEHAAFEKFKSDAAEEKALEAKKTAYRSVLKDAGIIGEKAQEKALRKKRKLFGERRRACRETVRGTVRAAPRPARRREIPSFFLLPAALDGMLSGARKYQRNLFCFTQQKRFLSL